MSGRSAGAAAGHAGAMRGRDGMDEGLRKEIERLVDADVQDELPEAVEAELRRLMADDERRLISLCADITPDGEYGERWFVATDRRLALLATENGEARVEVEVPWSQVRRLRLRAFIGGALWRPSRSRRRWNCRGSAALWPRSSRAPTTSCAA